MNEFFKSVSFDGIAAELVAVTGEQKLAGLVAQMKQKGITIATAESCTGGLIGKLLTGVPGASAVYPGGIITYTNRIKTDILGVNSETIEKYTEVSAETAKEMAERAREKFCSDIGVSATGFAGPEGGNEKDPVGTVYIAAATQNETVVLRLSFDSEMSRENIRLSSSYVIFGLVDRILQKME
ncbi:MAG: CinA family protein [Ruminococcaceae bacterium]|nr:CinA family protein [Oscillospiraceae bacterium]